MANSLNTINVDGTTYNAEEYAELNKVVKKNDELGKDAFLQLLVAQMKYQDPLEPQDNSSFVAELAQFSALEQMTNVASNLEDLSEIVNNMDGMLRPERSMTKAIPSPIRSPASLRASISTARTRPSPWLSAQALTSSI